MLTGVSIVICCHNSARRLPQTLAHLAAQRVEQRVPWEVVVVDNASTDDTSRIALRSWTFRIIAPLRVVCEPQLGLSYARHRGFTEAEYEVVSFIDDDNWVCPEWVQLVWEVMNKYPEVGACGGVSEAACEVDLPWWFERYKSGYAVGPQGQEAGDVTTTRGFLWGAGLTVRRFAWQQLVDNGFRSLCVGRRGSSLTSGEDVELCFALRLAGWRLWYEQSLRLHHFLPAYRLEWNYLRCLIRGVGASTVGFDPYNFALSGPPKTFKEQLQRTWKWQILAVLKGMLRYRRKLPLSFRSSSEGDDDVLQIEYLIGRLSELLRNRGTYSMTVREVRNALFRRLPNSVGSCVASVD